MMLLFTVTSFSQEETVIAETVTERVIDKYSDKIISGFNDLIEGVTPLAEEGFSIVVKLQIAKGIAYMLILPITILLWIIFYINYRNLQKVIGETAKKDSWVEYKSGTLTVIFLISSIASTIGLIPAIYYGLMYLIAPEWFAIKEILNLL